MKILFVMCAEAAIVDRFSGNMSLINIIERLEIESYPTLIPRLNFVTFATREKNEPEQVDGKVEISVGGKAMISQKFPLSFEGKLHVRHVLFFSGVPLFTPGDLKLSVKLGDAEQTHTVVVEFRPQELTFATEGDAHKAD